MPVWVGDANPKKAVTAQGVQGFANAIRKTLRYQQDNLRDGIMLAWAFRPDALAAAERRRRLEQVRIDSSHFREQLAAFFTDHADCENCLAFVQPPRAEVGHKRVAPRTTVFDVSETVVLNSGAKIINVQWDFDYAERFSRASGLSFVRGAKCEPQLQAQYEFPRSGKVRVACKVQDDMGGEGLWSGESGWTEGRLPRSAAAVCALDRKPTFTAVIKQDSGWWIGWMEEVSGVNAQERTKEALLALLREILREVLEFNRAEARKAAENNYVEEFVTVRNDGRSSSTCSNRDAC